MLHRQNARNMSAMSRRRKGEREGGMGVGRGMEGGSDGMTLSVLRLPTSYWISRNGRKGRQGKPMKQK